MGGEAYAYARRGKYITMTTGRMQICDRSVSGVDRAEKVPYSPHLSTNHTNMEGIANKLKSCTCPKEAQKVGAQACPNCSTGQCSCKTNKCKCASCPNARKSVKEGSRKKHGNDGSSSSSSSSDEEGANRRRNTAGQPVEVVPVATAPGTTTTGATY